MNFFVIYILLYGIVVIANFDEFEAKAIIHIVIIASLGDLEATTIIKHRYDC